MNKFAATALTLVGCCLLLGGCARMNSIYRNVSIGTDPDSSQVLLIDAKQRAILTANRPVQQTAIGTNDKVVNYTAAYRAFCTEQSPDVFSVLSQALSASGSFGQDKDSLKAALQAAFSSSEAGSTIPRTQTVNMLREMMYRTCERYLSGALSSDEFSTQAIRDQRIMVSILAIEQLTGAVTPHPVALSSGATAGSGNGSTEVLAILSDAFKGWQTAKTNLEKAQASLTEVDKQPTTACATLLPLLAKGPNPSPVYPDQANDSKKAPNCKTAQDAVDTAATKQKEAKAHYDMLVERAQSGAPISVSTSGQILTGSENGGIDQTQSVSSVAGAVLSIVQANFNDEDEYLLFCIRTLGQNSTSPLAPACQKYADARFAVKTAEQSLDAAKLDAAAKEISKQSGLYFDKFWTKVVSADPNTADPAKLKKTVTDYLDPNNPNSPWVGRLISIWSARVRALATSLTKVDVQSKFNLLADEIQADLAK